MNMKFIIFPLLVFTNLHSSEHRSDAIPVATHPETDLNQLDFKATQHEVFSTARAGKTEELKTALTQPDSIDHTKNLLKTNQDLLYAVAILRL